MIVLAYKEDSKRDEIADWLRSSHGRSKGYDIIPAADGYTAIFLMTNCRAAPIDAVLIDLDTPGGNNIVNWVKTHHPGAPVILMGTARTAPKGLPLETTYALKPNNVSELGQLWMLVTNLLIAAGRLSS